MRSRNYVLVVDVVPVDQFRYRYEYSTWFVAGTEHSPPRSADAATPTTADHGSAWTGPGATAACDVGRRRQTTTAGYYVHPESPATGDYLMRQSAISFYRLKLTNNAQDQHGNVGTTITLVHTIRYK